MVNIVPRMRKLRQLLWIRCGPGALVLPPEVRKLSLEFNTKLYGGHRGARKFWREMMPRMKYRNPAVQMGVARHADAEGPSVLRIWMGGEGMNSPTSSLVPDTSPPTHTLDIKNQHESAILDLLIASTGATPLEATAQEKEEMEEFRAANERSERDRAEVREKLVARRREEEMLRVARGEMGEGG